MGVAAAPIMGISAQDFVDAANGGDLDDLGARLRAASLQHLDASCVEVLQDVRKGHRTEIEELNGYVAAKAAELGLDAPACQALADIVRKAGVGGLVPDKGNLEALASIAR